MRAAVTTDSVVPPVDQHRHRLLADVLGPAFVKEAFPWQGTEAGEEARVVRLTVELPEEALSALRETPERFAAAG